MTVSTWRSVAVALAAALVLSLGGLTYALVADDGGDDAKVASTDHADQALDLSNSEAAAVKAARAAAVHLTTYDYKSLDSDFAWIDDVGTDRFKAQYATVIGPTRTAVAELKAHAVGTVDQAAGNTEDADHVTVLLFVDQTLTSAASPERKLVTPRITMSMVRVDGRWLVDDVALRNLAAG